MNDLKCHRNFWWKLMYINWMSFVILYPVCIIFLITKRLNWSGPINQKVKRVIGKQPLTCTALVSVHPVTVLDMLALEHCILLAMVVSMFIYPLPHAKRHCHILLRCFSVIMSCLWKRWGTKVYGLLIYVKILTRLDSRNSTSFSSVETINKKEPLKYLFKSHW